MIYDQRQLKQYRQMILVGRGNFVDVYEAEDNQEKQNVLIKQLRSRLSQDDRSAFLEEVGIMALNWQSGSQKIHQLINAALYMAPERFLGMSKPASDQYSLAVIIYEWFTGKPLLHGTPNEIIRQRLTTSPSSQLRDAKQIPSTVKQALLKALARNPEERFGTITAFIASLDI